MFFQDQNLAECKKSNCFQNRVFLRLCQTLTLTENIGKVSELFFKKKSLIKATLLNFGSFNTSFHENDPKRSKAIQNDPTTLGVK